MDTSRILDQLLGGGAGRSPGPGGLDALLGGLTGGGRGGGAVPPGRAPSAGGGGLGGGSLGDLLGSLAGGRGGPAASGGGLGGLLGGLLGGGAPGSARPPMGGGGLGGLGGAAAGGLLGSILGGGRRGGGGGLMRAGGMALLGLLAHRAFEQWKQQQAQAQNGSAPATPKPSDFARAEAPDREGNAFGLSVVRAMVAAARADGRIDEREHERIFSEAEKLDLEPEEKGELFRVLETQADPASIAKLAATEAQRAEIYLASALVIGEQVASERAYLDALAHHLGLDRRLRATLDQQVREAAELEEQAASGGSRF